MIAILSLNPSNQTQVLLCQLSKINGISLVHFDLRISLLIPLSHQIKIFSLDKVNITGLLLVRLVKMEESKVLAKKLTTLFTRVNSSTTHTMDMAGISTETAIITLECGKMERDRDMENSWIKTAKLMRVFGRTVNLQGHDAKILRKLFVESNSISLFNVKFLIELNLNINLKICP